MAKTQEPSGDIRDVQPDRLIKYNPILDEFSGEVLLPGFCYTDFAKYNGGRVTPFALAELLLGIHYTGPKHAVSDLLTGSCVTVTKICQYKYHDKLHDIMQQTHFGVKFPLLIKGSIVHVGNSSLTERSVMSDYGTGEELVTMTSLLVYVDAMARKSIQLPDWFKSKWQASHKNIDQDLFPRSDPLGVPSDAYQYAVMALYTDADENGHVNRNIYIKWLNSAWLSAISQGVLRDFEGSVDLYVLESISIEYEQEVLPADAVKVCLWQDHAVPTKIYFRINKTDASIARGMLTTSSLRHIAPSRL